MASTTESLGSNVGESNLQVVEYESTASALVTLKEKYGGVIYDVTTAKGMKEAKDARKVVRNYRTSLESKRKEIKAPALQRCRDIDDEAKAITVELRSLEGPIDEQIKAEDQRKQREKEEADRRERERVETIKDGIDAILLTPGQLIGKPVSDLESAAIDLRMSPIAADAFAEFTQEALAAKQQAMQQLASMIEAAKAQEELAEMKRKQVEQEAEAPEPAPEPADESRQPIDTSRLAAAEVSVDPAQPGADRAVIAERAPDNRLAAMRADLIANAGLHAGQADAAIEAIQTGRIRHLTITE